MDLIFRMKRTFRLLQAVEITDETDTLLFSSTFSMYCISAEG